MENNNKTSIVIPSDSGPLYAETDMSRCPVEPWSVVTNLIFLFIVIYWCKKIKFNYRRYPLLTIAIPFIFIGFCGGELYHSFRNYRLWLILDYVPILLLVLIAGVYLWQLIYKNIFLTFISSCIPIIIYRVVTYIWEIPENFSISAGYAVLAFTVTLPAVLHCIFRNSENKLWLISGALSFAAAIIFRQFDFDYGTLILPGAGTHFLWHIFGGISAFLLMQYIYTAEEKERKNNV